MHEDTIRELQGSLSEVAMLLAELRDEYLKLEGFRPDLGRFGQLDDAYSNLLTAGDALVEYMEAKGSLFGKKPNREVCMITKAAVQNSKVLAELARGELSLLQGSHSVATRL